MDPKHSTLGLLFLLVSCGRAPLSHVLDRPALSAEYQRVLRELPAGWPSATDCDGALWAGEARLAGDGPVDMSEALAPDGRPTRRPDADCGPGAGAPATTSTDMMLGTVAGLWAQRDLSGLELMQDYADSHDLVMGTPHSTATDLSYTLMKPGTRALLAQAIRNLGGEPTGAWVEVPQLYDPLSSDFSTHLAFLSAELQQRMHAFSEVDRAELALTCSHDATDAFVQAVCGNTGLAEELILGAAYRCPSYVRGAPAYCDVHRLSVLNILTDGGA